MPDSQARPDVERLAARIVTDARRFPVQARDGLPKSVPWFMVAPHEEQAQINHGQTLERLAERGGLSPGELWALVHRIRMPQPRPDAEYEMWLVGINDLRIATVDAECVTLAAAPLLPEEPSEAGVEAFVEECMRRGVGTRTDVSACLRAYLAAEREKMGEILVPRETTEQRLRREGKDVGDPRNYDVPHPDDEDGPP